MGIQSIKDFNGRYDLTVQSVRSVVRLGQAAIMGLGQTNLQSDPRNVAPLILLSRRNHDGAAFGSVN